MITFHPSSVHPLTFSNDFSSEAAEPILLKFHMEPPLQESSGTGGLPNLLKELSYVDV